MTCQQRPSLLWQSQANNASQNGSEGDPNSGCGFGVWPHRESNLSYHWPTDLPAADGLEVADLGRRYQVLSFSINNVAMSIVFFLGIAGNVMNLVVLGRKRFRKGLDHVERSALAGLIFLAVSDGMFCVSGLPGAVLIQDSPAIIPWRPSLAGLYYGIYRTGMFNTFLFCSTWMTVAISLERYLAVCHPFRARAVIKIHRSVSVHVLIFLVSVLVNLPLFFIHEICTGECSLLPDCVCHYVVPTSFFLTHKALFAAQHIGWAILGTGIPFVLLLGSNARLMCAVCKASRMSPALNNEQEKEEQRTSSRITISLIAMVISFLVLVGPSMVLTFLSSLPVLSEDTKRHYDYRIILLLTNFCQAVKFATNFALYCATSRQFRSDVSRVVCSARAGTNQSAGISNRYNLVEVPDDCTADN